MKQFFKFVAASMVGFLLSVLFLFLVTLLIIFGAVAQVEANKKVKLVPNSVLHIRLDHPVNERSANRPFGMETGFFGNTRDMGLDDILAGIKKAKSDKNIKGIYLDLSAIPAGISTIEEIRHALLDFKTSKKFVVAYGEVYMQTAYYLASVADKIFLNPQGLMELRGLSAEIMFYKGALEKLEIEPQVIRHGRFKSAIEPFVLDKMSAENRTQVRSYVGSIWNHLVKNIAVARNLEAAYVQSLADSLLIQSAEEAVKYKMVDQLVFKDELLDALRKDYLKVDKEHEINFVNFRKYAAGNKAEPGKYGKDRIAVIYAQGAISGGKGNETAIGSERISEAIRKARLDKKVKAIVLRVNSPGGSALASDVIWREVILAKKEKPVIASMGDVAASGGYYISCGADAIVAQPTTVTGSIGVFGLLFNFRNMMNNKLGLTTDTVNTAMNANFGSMTRPLSEYERAVIQKAVEKIYDDFITKVAEGRKIEKAYVDSIGEGRVWSGSDALNLRLVDALGGIDTAIAIAAEKAKLKDYRIVSLPERKDGLEEFLAEISDDARLSIIGLENEHSLRFYRYYNQIESILKMNGIQALMPYEIAVY